MELDNDLCLCFHVSKRKVVNFLKHQKPKRASQISECFGAGTGCGWCRPFLQKLWEQSQEVQLSDSAPADHAPKSDNLPTAAQYAEMRAGYLKEKREDES